MGYAAAGYTTPPLLLFMYAIFSSSCFNYDFMNIYIYLFDGMDIGEEEYEQEYQEDEMCEFTVVVLRAKHVLKYVRYFHL